MFVHGNSFAASRRFNQIEKGIHDVSFLMIEDRKVTVFCRVLFGRSLPVMHSRQPLPWGHVSQALFLYIDFLTKNHDVEFDYQIAGVSRIDPDIIRSVLLTVMWDLEDNGNMPHYCLQIPRFLVMILAKKWWIKDDRWTAAPIQLEGSTNSKNSVILSRDSSTCRGKQRRSRAARSKKPRDKGRMLMNHFYDHHEFW